MRKNISKEIEAQIADSIEIDVVLALDAEEELAKKRRMEAHKERMRNLVRPTDEEDKAITAAAIADPDSKPFTDAEWAQAQKRRPGRPTKDVTKVPTSIRLDARVVDAFKATGNGWQTRINDALLEYASEHEMLDF